MATRAWSAATPSVLFTSRSMMWETLIYSSAERRTPDRVRENSSSRVGGRESSRPGGKTRSVNSSCTEMVACFRHTASSYKSRVSFLADAAAVVAKEWTTNSRDSEEHNHQLFLAENGVSDESIQEPSQPSSPFLYKGTIVGQVVTIYSNPLGWQEWQHPERISLVQAV